MNRTEFWLVHYKFYYPYTSNTGELHLCKLDGQVSNANLNNL